MQGGAGGQQRVPSGGGTASTAQALSSLRQIQVSLGVRNVAHVPLDSMHSHVTILTKDTRANACLSCRVCPLGYSSSNAPYRHFKGRTTRLHTVRCSAATRPCCCNFSKRSNGKMMVLNHAF
jgi:hypothetical protein